MLIAGLALAILGGNLLISGATTIARRFNLSDLLIGATVVAFGTSMPELTVNLFSVAANNTDLAIANVLGSNIFNILVILGITALISPLIVQDSTFKKDIPFSLMAVILVGACGNEALIDGLDFSALTRSDGIVFISFFIIFLYYSFSANPPVGHVDTPAGGQPRQSAPQAVAWIVVGLVGLFFGGEWIVNGATVVAAAMGMDAHSIGIIIIGPGTSLPELISSIVAARRGHMDMAVGNVVGSNIFNIFLVLGMSAIIRPLPLSFALNLSVMATALSSILLLVFAFIIKGRRITNAEGICFIALYVGYAGYLVAA
jgi:cation:H+ antiporter